MIIFHQYVSILILIISRKRQKKIQEGQQETKEEELQERQQEKRQSKHKNQDYTTRGIYRQYKLLY